jgi:hypothetical protein
VDYVADVFLDPILFQGRDICKDAGISATVGRLFSEEPQAAIEEAGPARNQERANGLQKPVAESVCGTCHWNHPSIFSGRFPSS